MDVLYRMYPTQEGSSVIHHCLDDIPLLREEVASSFNVTPPLLARSAARQWKRCKRQIRYGHWEVKTLSVMLPKGFMFSLVGFHVFPFHGVSCFPSQGFMFSPSVWHVVAEACAKSPKHNVRPTHNSRSLGWYHQSASPRF